MDFSKLIKHLVDFTLHNVSQSVKVRDRLTLVATIRQVLLCVNINDGGLVLSNQLRDGTICQQYHLFFLPELRPHISVKKSHFQIQTNDQLVDDQ